SHAAKTALTGHLEPQRRDRDAIVGERRNVAAVGRRLTAHAHVGDPVIGVAAAVVALIDLQPLLSVAALGRHGHALDVDGGTIREVDVDEHVTGNAGGEPGPGGVGPKMKRGVPTGGTAA